MTNMERFLDGQRLALKNTEAAIRFLLSGQMTTGIITVDGARDTTNESMGHLRKRAAGLKYSISAISSIGG
ncbi:hypothetical protein [Acidiferrobacter sp.]|jgi:hypothetical protein|uniref:hypothetical protein n=2 Tax=Acidiferrobacter sp. TaxID=1872107 RepID=UPI002617E252|nr:hypothetical protein [Acidiferrobacter sp.]